MKNWQSFPSGRWSPVGSILTGYGAGVGSHNVAYTVDLESGRLLNGRISASILIAAHEGLRGAGLICRADSLHTFIAFHAISSTVPDQFRLRLSVFKEGALQVFVELDAPVQLDIGFLDFSLQFFTGEVVGRLRGRAKSYEITSHLPQLPFPGYCGVVRFGSGPATASKVNIEELAMRPKLERESPRTSFEYDVFVCHSSLDVDRVSEVLAAFNAAGVRYWVDHERISYGDSIIAKIEDGLQKSRFVAVCLSKNVNGANWPRAEYGPILYREFNVGTDRRVIPLTLDDSPEDQVPLLLSDRRRANFNDPGAFARFVRFLKSSKKLDG